VYYAARKGFWIYVPTNGRLLKPSVIDRLADAGAATFNLAIDAVDEKPGLPKALAPIRSYFDYLVKKQYRYGYTVFFNINICHNNLDDVKELTEIAHANKISTDYHINESPLLEQPHFKHLTDENPTYFRPDDYDKVDRLIDWLIEKQKAGYTMLNSVERLAEMKRFVRGAHHDPWHCRAGQNTVIIRVDGTLAPCFPMYSATHDWGVAGEPHFDQRQLATMKAECEPNCFSTLNHIVLVLRRWPDHPLDVEAGAARLPVDSRKSRIALDPPTRASRHRRPRAVVCAIGSAETAAPDGEVPGALWTPAGHPSHSLASSARSAAHQGAGEHERRPLRRNRHARSGRSQRMSACA
jgi:MoaA/NifB/PqqE/SkfB family radical SAM enzyme